MNEEQLTDSNFLLFAAKNYDNPQCFDTEEFYDDVKRFTYLKRLFGKYHESGEIKERLVLNHLIVLYNIFGINTTRMLFFKVDEFYYSYLKTFLILLDRMPESVLIKDKIVRSSDIPLDSELVKRLRKI